jgi:hypothetical protein
MVMPVYFFDRHFLTELPWRLLQQNETRGQKLGVDFLVSFNWFFKNVKKQICNFKNEKPNILIPNLFRFWVSKEIYSKMSQKWIK